MPKTTQFLRFPSPDGKEICFPVATVIGEKKGPRFVVTAGIHGCEYPGIAAAIALYNQLDPEKLRGVVSIVTIASVEAFETRSSFVCPVDGKNPNRYCPGRPDGTYTEAQMYFLLHDIIAHGDYHLDLHGGDLVEALDPFSICHTGADPEVDKASFELAYYYALPNLIKTTWEGDWPDKGTTYANAAVNGTPSAIVEVGGIGQMDQPSIDMHLKGLNNVLRHVGMLEGDAFEPEDVQTYRDFKWVYSPKKGIFCCQIAVGQELKKGQPLGYMTDYFGQHLVTVSSPVDGKVVFLTTSPAIPQAGLLMGIAYL